MNTAPAIAPKSARPRAIALLSGGLDSMLAAKLVAENDVEVIGLHLSSPFGCREQVKKTADALGVPLLVRDKGEAYLDLLQDPHYGYGRAMNPCIDCRIYMFGIAEKVRREFDADFIVTGEVLGQRPMSQVRKSMELIDEAATVNTEHGGRVLRPLSAKLMDPSLPETQGWVDREKLLGLSGRKRSVQLEMAEGYGLTEFGSPGGGCLLTEYSFAPRLKDFFKRAHHQTSTERMIHAELLRFGRHFRLSDDAKVILSRNAEENQQLEARWEVSGGSLFFPDGFSGPHALALGAVDRPAETMIGRMIFRYGKPHKNEIARIACRRKKGGGSEHIEVFQGMSDEELEALRI